MSSSGGLLLRQTVGLAGLDRELSAALSPWRAARATHDPGKVLLDIAITVALGGDCLADVAAVRAQPELFGGVASDATISRLVSVLAGDIDTALPAIRAAHAKARAAVWARRRPLAGTPGRRDGGQVVLDIDATLVASHSDKEQASATFKRGYGFHPMCAFVDHGSRGTGEPLTLMLRPGSASAWSSADHLMVLDQALEQLPEHEQAQVLVRTDTGGSSKVFLHHITDLGLEYSIGFAAHEQVKTALEALPEDAWVAAVDSNGEERESAQVAELTALLPIPVRAAYRPATEQWPATMRVIARRERPTPAPSSG
jgi:hypothetical protein